MNITIKQGLYLLLCVFILTRCKQTDSTAPITTLIDPDDVVYFGTDAKKLYSFDATTGKRKWEFATDAWPKSSIAKGNGLIYVADVTDKVYAINEVNGLKQWNTTTFLPPVNFITSLGGKTVVVKTEYGFLFSINNIDGTIKWSTNKAASSISTLITNESVFCIGYDNIVRAYETSSGVQQWEFPSISYNSQPSVHGGILYVTSGSKLYAIDQHTGNKKWETTVSEDFDRRLIIDTGYLYANTANEKLYAIDVTNGQVKWSSTTQISSVKKMVLYKGVLYIGSYQTLLAIDTATGKKKWVFTPTGINNFSDLFPSEGVIYAGTGNNSSKLYAIDIESGTKKWESSTGYSAIGVGNNHIYLSMYLSKYLTGLIKKLFL